MSVDIRILRGQSFKHNSEKSLKMDFGFRIYTLV